LSDDVFRPAGCSRLLRKLEIAYTRGYRRLLVHGLAGTSKTMAAKYFAWKKQKELPLYLLLPCTPNEACHFYMLSKSFSSVPGKPLTIILDELEKIVNREVIGWLCKTLDLKPHLSIGITNEPSYIKENIHPIWRRFTESGCLIYAPPPDYEERIHIVHAAARKLKLKTEREEAKKIASITEGYNFPEMVLLFKYSLAQFGIIKYERVLQLIKNRIIQPTNTLMDEEKYINDLHPLQVWDII